MQITIKGRHWKVTPDYREYAERRIEKLQRYFSHLISAQLTVTEEGYRHLAELRIFGNGFDLTGKAQNPDPKAALDAVLEKQERALKRRKERMKGHKKGGRTLRKDGIPTAPPEGTDRKRPGVEVIRIRPKPRTLTVDEAVRLVIRGRLPVLAFSDADGGGMRIAYRTEDGQVGVLELD